MQRKRTKLDISLRAIALPKPHLGWHLRRHKLQELMPRWTNILALLSRIVSRPLQHKVELGTKSVSKLFDCNCPVVNDWMFFNLKNIPNRLHSGGCSGCAFVLSHARVLCCCFFPQEVVCTVWCEPISFVKTVFIRVALHAISFLHFSSKRLLTTVVSKRRKKCRRSLLLFCLLSGNFRSWASPLLAYPASSFVQIHLSNVSL